MACFIYICENSMTQERSMYAVRQSVCQADSAVWMACEKKGTGSAVANRKSNV